VDKRSSGGGGERNALFGIRVGGQKSFGGFEIPFERDKLYINNKEDRQRAPHALRTVTVQVKTKETFNTD
jgi:hypothetical protein